MSFLNHPPRSANSNFVCSFVFIQPLSTSSWSSAAKSIASWLLPQSQQQQEAPIAGAASASTEEVSQDAPSADAAAAAAPADVAPTAVDAACDDLPPTGWNPMSDS